MDRIDERETPSHAVERHGLDYRSLRRSAIELISSLPQNCEIAEVARRAWVEGLHIKIGQLGVRCAEGRTVRQFFRNPPNDRWIGLLTAGPTLSIRCATTHEVKGREYDAVCVVIPPDRGQDHQTADLIDAWVGRRNEEARRVIYVGITRAMKLAVLAVPAAFRERVTAMLEAANVPFVAHDLQAPAAAP